LTENPVRGREREREREVAYTFCQPRIVVLPTKTTWTEAKLFGAHNQFH